LSRGRAADGQLPSEETSDQRQIDNTDLQIDQLIYELYDLTEEQIRSVEKGTAV